MRSLCLLVLLSACGGPVLQNVPAPNKAVAGGVVAGAAAAATLADPDGAAQKASAEEKRRAERDKKPIKAKTVPPDVLDRLDEAEKKKPEQPAPVEKPK